MFCDPHTQMILGVNFTLSSKLRLQVVFSRYFYSKISRDTVYMKASLPQQGALYKNMDVYFILLCRVKGKATLVNKQCCSNQ